MEKLQDAVYAAWLRVLMSHVNPADRPFAQGSGELLNFDMNWMVSEAGQLEIGLAILNYKWTMDAYRDGVNNAVDAMYDEAMSFSNN